MLPKKEHHVVRAIPIAAAKRPLARCQSESFIRGGGALMASTRGWSDEASTESGKLGLGVEGEGGIVEEWRSSRCCQNIKAQRNTIPRIKHTMISAHM